MFNNRYQFFCSDSITSDEKEVRVTRDASNNFEELKLPKPEEVKNSAQEQYEAYRHQMGYSKRR